MVILEELTWQDTKNDNASFCASQEDFVKLYGWKHFHKKVPFFRRSLIITPEIIYEPHHFLVNFKNAKVLLIGGGPSTLTYNFDVSNYDIVCSTNDYYLNAQIVSYVDFCCLNRRNQQLEPFRKLSCVVCFERLVINTKRFYEQYFNRSFLAYARYNSRLGIGTRQIVLCTLWGASEIHIIGIDGYTQKLKGKKYGKIKAEHAFKNKPPPRWYNYDRYIKLYQSLWEYLKYKIGRNVRYVNLGYGHPYNISSLYLDDKGNWLGPLSD